MDKYSVDIDPSLIKTAGTVRTCPRCGEEVEEHGGVPKCPVHGTAPFEKAGKISHGTKRIEEVEDRKKDNR